MYRVTISDPVLNGNGRIDKFESIKSICQMFGLGFKEARDLVDTMYCTDASCGVKPPPYQVLCCAKKVAEAVVSTHLHDFGVQEASIHVLRVDPYREPGTFPITCAIIKDNAEINAEIKSKKINWREIK
jgi:hypothetical protein